jgi:hypothetical protein
MIKHRIATVSWIPHPVHDVVNLSENSAMLAHSRRTFAALALTCGLFAILPAIAQTPSAANDKDIAAALRAGGLVIVLRHGGTYKPNIIDALGKDWFDVKEGEASIFRPEHGRTTLIARVQMTDWSRIVAAASESGVRSR